MRLKKELIRISLASAFLFLLILFVFLSAQNDKMGGLKNHINNEVYKQIINPSEKKYKNADGNSSWCLWNYRIKIRFYVENYEDALKLAQDICGIIKGNNHLSKETFEVEIKNADSYNNFIIRYTILGKYGYKGNPEYNEVLREEQIQREYALPQYLEQSH